MIKRMNVGRKEKGWALESSKIKGQSKVEIPGKENEKEQPVEWEDHYLFHLDYFNNIPPLSHSLPSNPYSPKQQVNFFVNHPITLPCFKSFCGFFLYLQELVLYCQSIQKHWESVNFSLNGFFWLSWFWTLMILILNDLESFCFLVLHTAWLTSYSELCILNTSTITDSCFKCSSTEKNWVPLSDRLYSFWYTS